jgi:hypothetical protein
VRYHIRDRLLIGIAIPKVAEHSKGNGFLLDRTRRDLIGSKEHDSNNEQNEIPTASSDAPYSMCKGDQRM